MDILFIDERADEYQTHCGHLEHQLRFETSVPLTPVCDIMVASPLLASAALKAGCEPKWIQSTWAGVDSLTPQLVDRSILLTGIKGIFGQLMSEYVFAFVLSDLRDLDQYKQQQSRSEWNDSKLPGTLANKTMAIVGTGSIGQHLAATAKHFRMNTIGVNRTGRQQANFDEVLTDLKIAVESADYVVACLPDTTQTRQVFTKDIFASMLTHSMFYNVGRGNSVNHSDLVDSLEKKNLRLAVLDVFSQEPLVPDDPLWSCENLSITPHISAPSFTSDIAKIFLKNLALFEKDEPLLHRVDPAVGY
jgi:phosphoglycerate dehydrogenase-like enzyme